MPEIKSDCSSVDGELDRRFGGHRQPLSSRARHHLQECERCQKLYQYLENVPSTSTVPPEVQYRITENVKSSLKPVSRLRSAPVLTAQFSIVFALLAAGLISMKNWTGIQAMSIGQLAGIGAILTVGVVLLSRSLALQMTPGSMQKIPAWAAVMILSGGLLAGFLFLYPWQAPGAILLRGWHCFRAGLISAVPAAALFWLLVRRGAPLNLITLGATLGALAGLLSVTVLQVTCNIQELGHLLFWHGGVLLISTAIGTLIGQSVGSVRLWSARNKSAT